MKKTHSIDITQDEKGNSHSNMRLSLLIEYA